MSIIVYRCDTCKREIERSRNIRGLEIVQRCTITEDCRGKMFQVKYLEDYLRVDLPDNVAGLENYVQRKALHNHTQSIERDEWTIFHDMGTFPVVNVYVNRPIEGNEENREEIIPTDIIVVSPSTLKLKFDRPYKGVAQLVARETDYRTDANEEQTSQQLLQISNQGEITLATKIETTGTSSFIRLNVRYIADNQNVDVEYVPDDQPVLFSPWSDSDTVLINGSLYTVRSYQGVIPQMTNGLINSGSTFRFISADYNLDGNINAVQQQDIVAINPEDVLILYAIEPYENIDKVRTSYIDVTSVTSTENPSAFVYSNGEFFAQPIVASDTYPPIRIIR